MYKKALRRYGNPQRLGDCSVDIHMVLRAADQLAPQDERSADREHSEGEQTQSDDDFDQTQPGRACGTFDLHGSSRSEEAGATRDRPGSGTAHEQAEIRVERLPAEEQGDQRCGGEEAFSCHDE